MAFVCQEIKGLLTYLGCNDLSALGGKQFLGLYLALGSISAVFDLISQAQNRSLLHLVVMHLYRSMFTVTKQN